MSRWTTEFRKLVMNATKNIDSFAFHALKCYVDDNNVVMEAILPADTYQDGYHCLTCK